MSSMIVCRKQKKLSVALTPQFWWCAVRTVVIMRLAAFEDVTVHLFTGRADCACGSNNNS